MEDVSIGLSTLILRHAVEVEVVDVLNPLHIHGEAFEAVGQLGRDRVAVEAADLLEIRELADLHAVAPDLPAEAPGAERRPFPVVFDEADVVPHRIAADGLDRKSTRLNS